MSHAKKMKWITALVIWLAAGNVLAQSGQQVGDTKGAVHLDAQQEKRALQSLLKLAEKLLVSAVDAMPADTFGFAPTDGEFKGVRTFGQTVRHLSATSHILAAAALGEEPLTDAGDEVGPETVRTKTEILNYLSASFAHLSKAIDAIGQTNVPVNPSPISSLKKGEGGSLGIGSGVVVPCSRPLWTDCRIPSDERGRATCQPAMENRFDNTPIACSLTTRELLDREVKLLAEFRSGVIETDGTSGGLCLSSSV